jgi:hypothetical protein
MGFIVGSVYERLRVGRGFFLGSVDPLLDVGTAVHQPPAKVE